MTPWDGACLALRLLAIDPAGLGGALVRARVGPGRDAFLKAARAKAAPVQLHPSMDIETLTGGIDVASSLGRGTLVRQRGVLHGKALRIELAMAERTPPLLTAHLSALMDTGQGHVLLALDEGVDADETIPPALADRLAFHLGLDGIALRDATPPQTSAAPRAIREIEIPPETCETLILLAYDLGIDSLRAPSFALAAARAHAALNRRKTLIGDDMQVAAALVYAPRATRLPQSDQEEPPAPPPSDDHPGEAQGAQDPTLDRDLLLEAVKAALPENLLDRLRIGAARGAKGAGSGKKRVGNRRGRPLPARDGTPRGSARVDILATLRAAIPWQTLRRQVEPNRVGALIRPSDLRYKRYQQQSDRLLIFTVDASGSAALARLGEAKGAVELLLAEAYARRDHVALIAFRGTGAETLLPPTRSLVQTKRRLAALPGGGGTPLAAGLMAAGEMAALAAKKGLAPTLVLLTDGRSNIALDGSPDRTQAATDATRAAHGLLAQDLPGIVIDTGNRPSQSLMKLTEALRGHYVSLPRADARGLSAAVSGALLV